MYNQSIYTFYALWGQYLHGVVGNRSRLLCLNFSSASTFIYIKLSFFVVKKWLLLRAYNCMK